MGLDSTMFFVSKNASQIDKLKKYYNDLTPLYGQCGVNVTGVYKKIEVEDFLVLQVDYRNTYDWEIIGKLCEDELFTLLDEVTCLYEDSSICELVALTIPNADDISKEYVADPMTCYLYDTSWKQKLPLAKILTAVKYWGKSWV